MTSDEERPLLDPSFSATLTDYVSTTDVQEAHGVLRDDGDAFHCHQTMRREESNAAARKATRTLLLSIVVCLLFMICEVAGGWLAQSLAIITDAAHLLTDFASMLISLFSIYLASRPASMRMSFGWHRAEVLGAFFSVVLIWVVTAILVYLAIQRIVTGEYEIDATVMAITAAVGVGVNILMGTLLYFGGHRHSHGGSRDHHDTDVEVEGQPAANSRTEENINLRAAFIHVLGDLVQSIGVFVAAIVIYFKNSWAIVDPICTLIFSVIVLCTTFYILRDALLVLLEGRPSSIDFHSVASSLATIDGVLRVHNLRIWSLTMDKIALSVHLEARSGSDARRIMMEANAILLKRFGIHECTVQIEDYDLANCGHCANEPQRLE